MKFFALLLVALPLAAAADKRAIFGDPMSTLLNLFSMDQLTGYVNQIVDEVGSDANEQQCEVGCVDVMKNPILDTSCPFLCTMFQELVHLGHIETTAAPAPADTDAPAPAKRGLSDLLGLFSTSDLTTYVNMIVDRVGSNATEQQCEGACHDIALHHVLDAGCPMICTLFQELVNMLHVDSAPAKRMLDIDFAELMGSVANGDLPRIVNAIVDDVGSDATEQQCENVCNGLAQSASTCALACSSLKELANAFHTTV